VGEKVDLRLPQVKKTEETFRLGWYAAAWGASPKTFRLIWYAAAGGTALHPPQVTHGRRKSGKMQKNQGPPVDNFEGLRHKKHQTCFQNRQFSLTDPRHISQVDTHVFR